MHREEGKREMIFLPLISQLIKRCELLVKNFFDALLIEENIFCRPESDLESMNEKLVTDSGWMADCQGLQTHPLDLLHKRDLNKF